MLSRQISRRQLKGALPRCRSYSTAQNSSPPNLKTTGFLSVALLTSAYALYQYESSGDEEISTSTPGGRPVSFFNKSKDSKFQLNIQTGRGVQAFEFDRKPDAEVERLIREHETSRTVARAGNPVVRWDNNWVGSNDPCEDRWATDLVERNQTASERIRKVGSFWKAWYSGDEPSVGKSGEGKRDLMMFSIMDGHAGDATSTLLQKALHPTLAVSLANLQAGYAPHQGVWSQWSGYLSPWYWLGTEKTWTPENVSQTIQNAYLQLDENICQTPVRLIPSLYKPHKDASSPSARQTLVALAEPAASGACAISTLVDSENDDLYVALAGDCRAIAGWQGLDGKWRCDVLTEDQMGENPREIERMRNEHPVSERETVIRNGRVQGGLQPTRAFGDAVYKWSNAEAAAIADAFKSEGSKPRAGRPWNYTPPYVTARPEITYRKLHPESGERLRFIVMATDGLWDRITSEEAALLTASYLSHPTRKPIPKTSLPKLFPLAPPLPKSEQLYPAQELPQPEGETWVYEGDENAATHLIRNSLAGGDVKLRGELMSLSGKVSRWMRDDVTVSVVFFGDE
ncbi:hypothetical protein IAR50_001885 [Cryptococcus sp. DSM 104548]